MAGIAIDPNSPYELLIASMISVERAPQAALRQQKNDQELYKGILTDLDSTLSALRATLTTLNDPVASAFGGRAVRVPSGSPFTARATDKAALGGHTLEVQRLATADARVSQQYATAGTALRSFFDQNGGEQTFTLHVARPTADDPAARVAVSVAVTPEGTTDGAIMAEVQTAIDDALAAAVADGRLTSAGRPQVALVHETSGTARLSLRSASTGYAHRLEFTDSAGGLLDQLQLTRAGIAGEGAATSGGMLTAVGTSEADSALSSVFVLDGLTLYRDANEVKDALTGVTLSLTGTSAGQRTDFTVEPDSKATEDQLKRFVEKYNAALDYLKKKSAIDGTAKTRGALADDSAVRTLRSELRNDVANAARGFDGGLAALGLKLNDDGSLVLDKPDALRATMAADPARAAAFFTGDAGLAETLDGRLDRFLGAKGLLDARKDITDDRIRRLDTRIKDWDVRMGVREEQLRQQFAKLQETIALLQGQQNAFLSYYSF